MLSDFSKSFLEIDADAEIERITGWLRTTVHQELRRKGLVIAVSGGIDSAVCAGLSARAVGKEHAVTLLLPDRDSSAASRELGEQVAQRFGIPVIVRDITAILDSAGCYGEQDDALRALVPTYGKGWKNKIVLPSLLGNDRLNISRIVVESPEGETSVLRPTPDVYRRLVAATNYKQRVRTMLSYFHADALHYAVCGTPNLLEYDQGFFVKGGDGLADVKPIAHLYKTQVYQIARALGVPEAVISRPPTTDTYSLAQTQEEFFFALPYQSMDLCLYGLINRIPVDEIAKVTGLNTAQVERVYDDIRAKRKNAHYLQVSGLTVQE